MPKKQAVLALMAMSMLPTHASSMRRKAFKLAQIDHGDAHLTF